MLPSSEESTSADAAQPKTRRDSDSPRRDSARVEKLILDLFAEVQTGKAYVGRMLTKAFELQPDLSARARERVAIQLFALVRERRRLEFALAEGRVEPKDLPRSLLQAYRLLADGDGPSEPAPGINWESVRRVDERIAEITDPVRRLALSSSLPDFLAARLLEEHGEETPALAAALNTDASIVLRTNTLKTTREALVERLQRELAAEGVVPRPTRLSPVGIELSSRANVFALTSFHEGLFEVQDEASQVVAELVAPPPRSLVIDACAGSGGKTLALGALLKSQGRLVALDPSAERLEALRHRARRAGLSNLRALLVPESTPESSWPGEVAEFVGKAARVLVDAPCSGLGALRRKPDQKWRLSVEDLEHLPRVQEEITRRALELVAPGGRLIYATCTLLAAENERVVERLLAGGTLALVPAKEVLGRARLELSSDPSGNFLKFLPHRAGTDGFFAAVMRKTK